MTILRIILKNLLLILSRLAIRKHKIRFVIIAGWYGTGIVREGLYHILSEKMNVRRNIQNIWWDFSIPLEVLGYKDIRYNWKGWLAVITQSIYALIFNKSNPHHLILNVNVSNPSTAEYWSKIIGPELLIIVSHKDEENALFNNLIEVTKRKSGKIFVSDDVKVPEFRDFERFGLVENTVKTPQSEYDVNPKTPAVLLKTYPPIISAMEFFGMNKTEIIASLAKFNAHEEILPKVLRVIKKEN